MSPSSSLSSSAAEEGGLDPEDEELKLELEEPEELELEEAEELEADFCCSAASCAAAHALNSKLKAVIIFFLIFANLATLVELELETDGTIAKLESVDDVKSIIEKERASAKLTCSPSSSSEETSAIAFVNMTT